MLTRKNLEQHDQEQNEGGRKLAGKVAGNWSRDQSNYSDIRGVPTEHCGPDNWWLQGQCRYYKDPHRCSKVSGFIATRGKCDWWKSV
jgi:hypothetical protein